MFFHEIRSAIILPYGTTADTLFKSAQVNGYGHRARMANLAYAFVCDRPYRHVEPTARPLFDSMGHHDKVFIKELAKLLTYLYKPAPQPQPPVPSLVGKVVDKVAEVLGVIPPEPPQPVPQPPRVITVEELNAWLAVPETEARKTWRLGREAKARAKREAKRQAFINTSIRVAQRVAG